MAEAHRGAVAAATSREVDQRAGDRRRGADGEWVVTKALMSRSARVLMEGWVRVPGDSF